MLKLFPATDPWANLFMDLLRPLTETKTGNVFHLISVDRFSKLVRAVPLAGITATDVSSAFCRDWISVYGPPDTVLTDNGPQFASLFFQGVCNLMGIRNLYTSTYHPQANGQVERFNKTLVDMFMHYIEDHQDNWDELVSVFVLAYNSRPHRTMGVAPMDLVTPRRLSNLSLERMPDGMTPDPSQSVAEAKEAFLESLKALLPQDRNSIGKTQARYKRDYDKKLKPSFKHVLRLPIHPSLRGRDLPRPTRSTRMLPNPTDTDLGHRASVQMMKSRRRALITGRTILAPVGTTITTRVLNRGARPRTRLVAAVPRRRLDAAAAGATLGAPRRVAIPGLVGSRGLFPTITGNRPAGASSTGLLRPPKMVLLPLLVDVQEAPELVVYACTGRPLQDLLQSLGVPHRVRLRPGEQVV